VDHERVVGGNIAAIMEEDEEEAEKLWMELVKERGHLHAECTADKVEQEAACCQESKGCILDAIAKIIRTCAKLQRWWNTNIKERRIVVRREKWRTGNSNIAGRVKSTLQTSTCHCKRDMRSEYLQSVRGAEI
jgi:hypothetical protein